MLPANVKNLLFVEACRFLDRSRSPVHEQAVLGIVAKALYLKSESMPVGEQRQMLRAWEELFTEGRLAPGFDIRNSCRPWFHVRPKENRCSAITTEKDE